MQPTKAQKNAAPINSLKQAREALTSVRETLESTHNSRKTSIVVSLLEEADHNLEDRMIELGMVKKLEDSNEQ